MKNNCSPCASNTIRICLLQPAENLVRELAHPICTDDILITTHAAPPERNRMSKAFCSVTRPEEAVGNSSRKKKKKNENMSLPRGG